MQTLTGEIETTGARLVEIAVARLVPDPENERGQINESDELIQEMAASMRESGVWEPLQVFPIADDLFMVGSGHQRLAAARLAGLVSVPCLVFPAPADKVEQARRRLRANRLRRDLSAVQEARALQALHQADPELSQTALGVANGFSQSEVSNRLRMLRLPQPILKLIDEGKLTISHAREILRVPDDFVECDSWRGPTKRTPDQVRIWLAEEAARWNTSVNSLAGQMNNLFESNQRSLDRHHEREAARERDKLVQQAQAGKLPKDLTPQQLAKIEQDRQTEEERRRQAAEEQRKEEEARERDQSRKVDRVEVAGQVIDRLLADDGLTMNLHLVRLGVVLAASAARFGELGHETDVFARVIGAQSPTDLLNLLMEIAREGIYLDPDRRQMGTDYTRMDSRARKYLNQTHFLDEAIAFALYDANLVNRATLASLVEGTNRNPKLVHQPGTKSANLREVRYKCPKCSEKALRFVDKDKPAGEGPLCTGYHNRAGKVRMIEVTATSGTPGAAAVVASAARADPNVCGRCGGVAITTSYAPNKMPEPLCAECVRKGVPAASSEPEDIDEAVPDLAAAAEYEERVRNWMREHAGEYRLDPVGLAEAVIVELIGQGAENSEDDYEQLLEWATLETGGQVERACRICGCTDEDGCEPDPQSGESCSWVGADLCSRCVGKMARQGTRARDIERKVGVLTAVRHNLALDDLSPDDRARMTAMEPALLSWLREHTTADESTLAEIGGQYAAPAPVQEIPATQANPADPFPTLDEVQVRAWLAAHAAQFDNFGSLLNAVQSQFHPGQRNLGTANWDLLRGWVAQAMKVAERGQPVSA